MMLFGYREGVISIHPHPCIAAVLIFSPAGYFATTNPTYLVIRREACSSHGTVFSFPVLLML
nr:MAG TPA: hypothetical protein [Caudoviricetes sp.]